MKWIRSIDLKEFASGCDAFGSAATDVSAISLKSTGCQKEHIYFNQNAESSVAAEPNASQPVANCFKSIDRIHFIHFRIRQTANANFPLAVTLQSELPLSEVIGDRWKFKG